MSVDKESVVLSFLNLFHGDQWPDFDQAVSMFAENCVCYVVYPTTPPVKGRAALRQELERQARDSSNPKCVINAVANNGKQVFVERVDSFLTLGKPLSISINSVFDVNDDGLIEGWREYMDPMTTARQLGISFEDLAKLLEG
ncbi:MAG: limonene-1,2-epoxide hydrolase family protein [Porticoccaceae bacterium]|jgi:limonene-1,2-epoxide hydrolase